MPAPRARYRLAAGPVRNGQMLRNASEEAAAYRLDGPTGVLVVAFPGRGGTGIPPAAGPSPPGAFAALHRNPRSGDLRQPQQGGSAPNHLLHQAFNI
ncbi:MAG: hypothetical protein ACK52U_02255 [Synechococcaceae cyanobacterium]